MWSQNYDAFFVLVSGGSRGRDMGQQEGEVEDRCFLVTIPSDREGAVTVTVSESINLLPSYDMMCNPVIFEACRINLSTVCAYRIYILWVVCQVIKIT
jgi:hypothetical protein